MFFAWFLFDNPCMSSLFAFSIICGNRKRSKKSVNIWTLIFSSRICSAFISFRAKLFLLSGISVTFIQNCEQWIIRAMATTTAQLFEGYSINLSRENTTDYYTNHDRSHRRIVFLALDGLLLSVALYVFIALSFYNISR